MTEKASETTTHAACIDQLSTSPGKNVGRLVEHLVLGGLVEHLVLEIVASNEIEWPQIEWPQIGGSQIQLKGASHQFRGR